MRITIARSGKGEVLFIGDYVGVNVSNHYVVYKIISIEKQNSCTVQTVSMDGRRDVLTSKDIWRNTLCSDLRKIRYKDQAGEYAEPAFVVLRLV